MADTLAGCRVVLGVGGSVAAYKAAVLLRALQRRGAQVRVILTQAGARFVGAPLLEALSGQTVATELFSPGVPDHVQLARWAEFAVVAPATADLLAKCAHGLADDYLSTWLLAFPGPVLLAPAMNRHMWSHPAVQGNVGLLRRQGATVLDPGWGPLGSPEEGQGWGRLPEPEAILHALEGLAAGGGRRPEMPPPLGTQPLAGRHVLVTAGPTREYLDPVRYLSNPSSGRMGYALAEAARDAGARVTLVSGPVHLAAPSGVDVVLVESARQMRAAVRAALETAHVVIAAAAVADWRPEQTSEVKLKKGESGETQELRLVRNPDILAEVGAQKGDRILVGFAAESGAGPEEGLRKLRNKHLDLCVYNDLRQPGGVFGAEQNTVVIWDAAGASETVGPLPKRLVAERILARIAGLLCGEG